MNIKDKIYNLKKERDFWESIRTWEGITLDGPSEIEFELEDEIEELENRDEFGIPRY